MPVERGSGNAAARRGVALVADVREGYIRRSQRGRIVHIASTGGQRAVPEFAHYVAATPRFSHRDVAPALNRRLSG